MRIGVRLVGVGLLVVGAVFVGQGLGFIPGSFMTGVRFWFYVGVVGLVVGLGLLLGSFRRTAPRA